jgi:hypothetical protein
MTNITHLNYTSNSPIPEGFHSVYFTLFENPSESENRTYDYTLKISLDLDYGSDYSIIQRNNKDRFDNYCCKLNTPAKDVFRAMKRDPDAIHYIDTIKGYWDALKRETKEPEQYRKIDNLKIGRIYESTKSGSIGEVMPFYTGIVFQDTETRKWIVYLFIEGVVNHYLLSDEDFNKNQLNSNIIAKLHLSKKLINKIKPDRPKTHAEMVLQKRAQKMMIATLRNNEDDNDD